MRGRGHRGFTLVELMVGLAVMAMLLLAALPLGRYWVNSNRQMQMHSTLLEGVSQARALALRNPAAQRASEPAATLQLRAGVLEVVVPGNTTPLWSADVRSEASFMLTDDAGFADAVGMQASGNPVFDCVSFDARGLRLPGADGCSDSSNARGRIAIGLASQDPLYVDML